jgi:hypothetical protein
MSSRLEGHMATTRAEQLQVYHRKREIEPMEECDDDKEPSAMQRGDRWGLIRPEEQNRGNACGHGCGVPKSRTLRG